MDHSRTKCGTVHGMVPLSKEMSWGSTPVWFSALVAVVLLTIAGVAYRAAASRLQGDSIAPVKLPIPLKQIPMQVDGWTGEDLSIPEVTIAYMERHFADDFISRRYTNAAEGLRADVYVVYCSSRPGGILGHQPLVCFPANGWIHDGTEPSQVVSRSGRPINCLVHRFHKPAPAFQEAVVLSFYVLNGRITLSERDFSGSLGRRPNLSGDPARYVAQVQVTSVREVSARAAASQMADIILAFLPDQNGM
jgi:hypothetical protein